MRKKHKQKLSMQAIKEIISESSLEVNTFAPKIRPKLILSDKLIAQITFLHSIHPSKEWSGAVFYSVESGSRRNIDQMVLKAHEMWPMDLSADTAYTEFDWTSHLAKYYQQAQTPEQRLRMLGYRFGLIHTHHSMKTFFSGVDTTEIRDNAKNYNGYLSLIVNYDGAYTAKLAFDSPSVRIINDVDDTTYECAGPRAYEEFELDIRYESAFSDEHIASIKLRAFPERKAITGFRSESPSEDGGLTTPPKKLLTGMGSYLGRGDYDEAMTMAKLLGSPYPYQVFNYSSHINSMEDGLVTLIEFVGGFYGKEPSEEIMKKVGDHWNLITRRMYHGMTRAEATRAISYFLKTYSYDDDSKDKARLFAKRLMQEIMDKIVPTLQVELQREVSL